MCNSGEEGGARGRGGGNKAINSSRHKNLAWMACANDLCNAVDTRWRNHVHNIVVEGPDPAQPLQDKDAHSTKNPSDLANDAPYVSKANSTNIVPLVRSR